MNKVLPVPATDTPAFTRKTFTLDRDHLADPEAIFRSFADSMRAMEGIYGDSIISVTITVEQADR